MTHPLKTTNNLQNLLTQRNQLVIYISINYNDSDYQPHMNLFFFFLKIYNGKKKEWEHSKKEKVKEPY